jgi:cell division protein FtsB
MSVKMPAKKAINIPRNAIAGQQSAHRPTRLPRPLISS